MNAWRSWGRFSRLVALGWKEATVVDMSALVGSIRCFGLVGPAYEIVGPAAPFASSEPRMRIRLLESDETLDYPIDDILRDPEAD